MRNFKNFEVWQKAHQLTLDVYRITKQYPKEELYGLVSQMRKSSASVSTNISEGCGRFTDLDFARFITIASGSALELEYQFLLSFDLNYINNNEYQDFDFRVNEIKKMLASLHSKLTAKRKR